jgi:hypothetical protein
MDTKGFFRVFNKILLGASIAAGIAFYGLCALVFLAFLTMDHI